MDRWVGKTALVTGASAGIGAAVCTALAGAGFAVVGLARRPELVQKLQSEVTGDGRIIARQCDLSKPEEVAAAFQWVENQLGGVDLLVNNAGVHVQGHITDLGGSPMKDEELSMMIDVNLRGLVQCTRLAVASMKRRQFDGHIININSIAGHYIPFSPQFNVYPTTKHAVTAFTESLANEFAAFNSHIKTTSISPGLVATDMTSSALYLVDFIPLRPVDVADAVIYVVSTPPNVNITELTIRPVAEKRL